jgi:hypothetical protein
MELENIMLNEKKRRAIMKGKYQCFPHMQNLDQKQRIKKNDVSVK